jgi:hypothetical protein
LADGTVQRAFPTENHTSFFKEHMLTGTYRLEPFYRQFANPEMTKRDQR